MCSHGGYCPANDHFKSSFSADLVRVCHKNPLPTLVAEILVSCVTLVKRAIINIMTVGLSCSMLLLMAF
jgi:hypothetical protein